MMNNQPTDQYWKELVIELKDIAREKRILQSKIAEKTGLSQQSISRIFNLQFSPTLKNLVAIADALGMKLILKDL